MSNGEEGLRAFGTLAPEAVRRAPEGAPIEVLLESSSGARTGLEDERRTPYLHGTKTWCSMAAGYVGMADNVIETVARES